MCNIFVTNVNRTTCSFFLWYGSNNSKLHRNIKTHCESHAYVCYEIRIIIIKIEWCQRWDGRETIVYIETVPGKHKAGLNFRQYVFDQIFCDWLLTFLTITRYYPTFDSPDFEVFPNPVTYKANTLVTNRDLIKMRNIAQNVETPKYVARKTYRQTFGVCWPLLAANCWQLKKLALKSWRRHYDHQIGVVFTVFTKWLLQLINMFLLVVNRDLLKRCIESGPVFYVWPRQVSTNERIRAPI